MKLGERLTPIILSIVTVIFYIDTHALHPFLSVYAIELGAGILMAGIIVAAYSLFEDIFEMPMGYLMDKLGRRKFFIIAGLVMDAISMVFYTLSARPLALLGTRIFHGVGGSIAGPAVMSLTADIPHPLARLGPRMGLYGVSIITATILGWVLGGVLVVKLGYSWLFQTVAIVLIIGAIMSIIIKELPPLIEKEEIPKISAKEAISKLRRLLKNKSYTIAVISIFAHMMTMGALVALLAPHLQILWLIEKEKAAFYAGMIFASYGISCLIFQVPMGYFSEKYGRRISLVAGLALVSVSMMALSIAPSFFLLVIIAGIYGASYSLLFPTICAMVIESARPNERALASSFFHIMFTEGVVVGAPLFAKVAHMYGYAIGLRFSCLAPLVVMVIALVLLKEKT